MSSTLAQLMNERRELHTGMNLGPRLPQDEIMDRAVGAASELVNEINEDLDFREVSGGLKLLPRNTGSDSGFGYERVRGGDGRMRLRATWECSQDPVPTDDFPYRRLSLRLLVTTDGIGEVTLAVMMNPTRADTYDERKQWFPSEGNVTEMQPVVDAARVLVADVIAAELGMAAPKTPVLSANR